MVRNEDDLELAKRFDMVSFPQGSWSCQKLNIYFGCRMQEPTTFPCCEQGVALAAEGVLDALVITVFHLGGRDHDM